MATGGLYGNASESVGLYGNTTNFGGSYFEWFIFYQSDTQPATPTGGSWSFVTNSGTAPTGWSTVPFPSPTLPVWVSIALVNSRSDVPLVWSAPGLFSYSSGLPILSGSGTPAVGDGINSQLYIQTSTTPQTIWFKQSGTWNRLVGSTLYADLTSAQTVAGIKTFSSPIVGSVTGTSDNVTGIVAIANGGTSSTTANGAFNTLAPSQTGNSGKFLTTNGTDTSWSTNPLGTVTSINVSGGTTGLTTSGGPVTTSGTITLAGTLAVANGGTGVTVSSGASSVMLRDANANVTINSITEGFVNVAAAGTTTTLTASSAPNYCVTGSGGQTYQLPDATTLTAGTNFWFNNNQSSGTIVVKNNSGTTIATIQSGGYVEVLLLANTPAAGSWDIHNFAPSNVSWSTNTFDYAGSITSATWNGVAVAINRGGTGQATAAAAITALTGTQTSAYYLRSNGTNATLSALSAADLTGTVAIATGGTGQTTANAAFNALAPSQTGNSGKYLTTDGSNTSWATNPLGTVTSVAATVPSFLSIAGSPITTSGTLAFSLSGTALPTTSGGTGLTSFTSGGVVYASSTSALATGSALTFDGTVLGMTAGAGPELRLSDSSYYSFVKSAPVGGSSTLVFGTDATERMRLTSTSLYTASGINVGVGTTSPSTYGKLAVLKGAGTSGGTDAPTLFIGTPNYGANVPLGTLQFGSTAASDAFIAYGGRISSYTGSGVNETDLRFYLNNAEKMRIASATGGVGAVGIGYTSLTSVGDNGLAVLGNVGIGTSSPTNYGPYGYGKTVEASGGYSGAFIVSSSGQTYKGGIKLYGATGDTIIGSISSNNLHLTTADAAPQVTLNTAGNLGLGVTPSAWGSGHRALDISGNSYVSGSTSMTVENNVYYNGTNNIYKNAAAATQYQQTNSGTHTWSVSTGTPSAGGIVSLSTAMTLTATGNLGIGETSPSQKLVVKSSGFEVATFNSTYGQMLIYLANSGVNFGVIGSGVSVTSTATYDDVGIGTNGLAKSIVFATGTSYAERARITSAGNLLVGTTSAISAGRITVSYDANTYNGLTLSDSGNTNSAGYIVFNQGSTVIGSITRVGATSAVAYNATSDYRLKTVVGSVTGQGARLDALKPIDYLWKENGQQARGFLAHEFQEVYANSVTGTKDAVDANGNPVYQAMQASTAEVIADLVAEIQSLRQRLSAANL